MKVTFSLLQEADLQETYQLCLDSFGESPAFAEIQKTWELCKEDPHYRFLVGKINGTIVAYASMILFHNLFDGLRPIATLWYVCVSKTFRGCGVGTQLFQEIERIARAEQVEIITLTCLTENEKAQKFYRSLGYKEDKEKAFVKYLWEEDTSEFV